VCAGERREVCAGERREVCAGEKREVCAGERGGRYVQVREEGGVCRRLDMHNVLELHLHHQLHHQFHYGCVLPLL